MISIHALREEGDLYRSGSGMVRTKFLSTPSARRATWEAAQCEEASDFISIHALREEGDTVPQSEDAVELIISIHALREEGDPSGAGRTCTAGQFLSTPSARRATSSYNNEATVDQFLSTPSARRATQGSVDIAQATPISIHALREEGDFALIAMGIDIINFYPRPPRGGRPITDS